MRSATPTNDPCRLHAPVLAALEEYNELDAFDNLTLDLVRREAVAAAREHLADCARCQARQRTFARLDDALRATVRAEVAPTWTSADLLAAIGADHEPRERRTPMLSVVTLRDEDDMDDENQAATGQDNDQRAGFAPIATVSGASSAPTFAPLPSLKPAQRPSPRRRALTGLVAVAAVIALIGGIAGAMNLSGRLHSGTGGKSATATATEQQGRQPGGGVYFHINALSMDSPTNGWAVVVNEANPSETYMLHIAEGVVVKQTAFSFGAFGPVTLQALSPTNVWMAVPYGMSNLYHYDGVEWAKVILPLPPGTEDSSSSMVGLHMVSPTEGWAIVSYTVMQDLHSVSKFAFYRFDGVRWHIEPADPAATVAEVPGPGSDSTNYVGEGIQIANVSVAPGGDVWATGWLQVSDQAGNTLSWTGYIYHRAGGVWHVAQKAKDYQFTGIEMVSPSLGWVIGEHIKTTKMTGTGGPYTVTEQDPVALAWDGARWSPAKLPALNMSQQSVQFSSIAASSPTDAWIAGQPNGSSFSGDGQYATDNTYLAHFDGVSWKTVALPQIAAVKSSNEIVATNQASFDVVATAASGDLWLAGGLSAGVDLSAPHVMLLFHYSGGRWTSIPLPALP